jgi:hypothetical protein
MYEEKRWYQRYPFCATAIIRRKDKPDDPPQKSLIGNISQTGIGLYVYEPVELDTAVSVEIEFFDMNKKRIREEVEGSIARIYQDADMFFIGIAFTEQISQDKQPNLYHHFHRVIKD